MLVVDRIVFDFNDPVYYLIDGNWIECEVLQVITQKDDIYVQLRFSNDDSVSEINITSENLMSEEDYSWMVENELEDEVGKIHKMKCSLTQKQQLLSELF